MRRETVKYITQFFAIFWTPEVIWQLFAIICDYLQLFASLKKDFTTQCDCPTLNPEHHAGTGPSFLVFSSFQKSSMTLVWRNFTNFLFSATPSIT